MVSEDKLIQLGIRQTEAWFKQFKNQVEKDLSLCDTYKEFLERTEEYTTSNIMVSSGYSDNMQDIIVKMLNDIKFKRASQRELIEKTIRYNVGNLITDVGEDIKQTTRKVVSRGYDEGIHPYEIGKNISKELDTINHKRARTIARTEVKRTDTIANYVIAKEDGATGFTVECRPDCCPYCAEEYDEHRTFEQQKARLQKIEQMKMDKIDDPLVRGKGEAIGGNKKFNIKDTSVLPPFHPNCRCTVYYIYDDVEIPRQTTEETISTPKTLTNEELNKMTFQELADYYGLEYRGESKNLVTKQREHFFVEVFEDDRRMSITFESNAVESYTKKGIATPNEIIAEVMKVPKTLRNETGGIVFRDTNKGLGIIKNGMLVDDELDANTLGYNRTRIMGDGYDHRIIINPRFFKGSRGPGAGFWIPNDEDIIRWKKNIHHEFEHSGDEDQALFDSDDYMPHSWSEEYTEVHRKEPYFTEYANSERGESWAEHGGYISYMEANPSEQHRKITIMVWDDDELDYVEKKINYAEYKQMYPAHYEFFMKRHKGE